MFGHQCVTQDTECSRPSDVFCAVFCQMLGKNIPKVSSWTKTSRDVWWRMFWWIAFWKWEPGTVAFLFDLLCTFCKVLEFSCFHIVLHNVTFASILCRKLCVRNVLHLICFCIKFVFSEQRWAQLSSRRMWLSIIKPCRESPQRIVGFLWTLHCLQQTNWQLFCNNNNVGKLKINQRNGKGRTPMFSWDKAQNWTDVFIFNGKKGGHYQECSIHVSALCCVMQRLNILLLFSRWRNPDWEPETEHQLHFPGSSEERSGRRQLLRVHPHDAGHPWVARARAVLARKNEQRIRTVSSLLWWQTSPNPHCLLAWTDHVTGRADFAQTKFSCFFSEPNETCVSYSLRNSVFFASVAVDSKHMNCPSCTKY